MSFFKSPESNFLKVFFLVVIIASSGIFLYSNFVNPGQVARIFNVDENHGGINRHIKFLSMFGIRPTNIPGNDSTGGTGTGDHSLNTSWPDGSTRYKDKVFTGKVVTHEQIYYAQAYNKKLKADESLYFNMYEPDRTTDTETHRPLVILIHGNFPDGKKDNDTQVDMGLNWFAPRGFVAISPDYRNGTDADTTQTEVMTDMWALLRFVRDPAFLDEYNIDPNRIFAFGTSAGGIVSPMLGVSNELYGNITTAYPGINENTSNMNGQPVWICMAYSESGGMGSEHRQDIDATDSGYWDWHYEKDNQNPLDKAQNTVDDLLATMANPAIHAGLHIFPGNGHVFGDVDGAVVEQESIDDIWDQVIIGNCPKANTGLSQIPW